MRTLSTTLSAAQKELGISPLYRIVLSRTGQTTVTYNEDRIISIRHTETAEHSEADVVLDNSDLAVTTDFKGYQGVISYGAITGAGEERSACAPLFVFSQENHSSQGALTVNLHLEGLNDLLGEDHASAAYKPDSTDKQTPKDFLTQVIRAVLTSWAASTAYVLDDLRKPTTANGFVYKCTTAGTSAGTEPTFPTTIGATVTDNTVVWTNQGIELTQFSHCVSYTPTFDSEDSLFDAATPTDAFQLILNDTRLKAIHMLLAFTRCVMRIEADGAVHFRAPTIDGDTWVALTAYSVNDYAEPTVVNNTFAFRCTTAGTTGAAEPTWPTTAGGTVTDGTVVWTAVDFDYEYRVDVPAQHDMFSKATRNRLTLPNFIQVDTSPHADAPRYTGTAEDTDSSDITNMEKRLFHYMTPTSNAQAVSLAKAILQSYRLTAQRGSADVPINVGQEVHDYVKFTDARQDDVRTGNVGAIQRVAGNGEWRMRIAFGETRLGGFLGLLPPSLAQMGEIGPVEDISSLVGPFNALVGQMAARLETVDDQIATMQNSIMALTSMIVSLSRRIDSMMLRITMDSLHVRSRLRIPVGANKFSDSDSGQ